MDFSFSDLNFNSVENVPGYEARAAFTVNNSSVFKEDTDIVPTIVDDTLSYIPWGGDNQMQRLLHHGVTGYFIYMLVDYRRFLAVDFGGVVCLAAPVLEIHSEAQFVAFPWLDGLIDCHFHVEILGMEKICAGSVAAVESVVDVVFAPVVVCLDAAGGYIVAVLYESRRGGAQLLRPHFERKLTINRARIVSLCLGKHYVGTGFPMA